MRYSLILAATGLVASVSAHGVVTKVVGANGVEMPGLSVADGTPRDCSSNGCGSQADTSIIRDKDIQSGATGPLGKTQGNGPVDAATMISNFMGSGAAPTNNGTGVGVEDDIPANVGKDNKVRSAKFRSRQLLGGLLGGGGGDNAKGVKSSTPMETMVKATAGMGATMGLPTAADDGTVELQYRQINQDGAGPLEAMVDGTSGGTDMAAFKEADVTQDVPGFVAGLSAATNTDFAVKVAMPQGMTCDATVGDAQNVCVVRVRNNTPAGPFGGSAAFTQTTAARKRAIAYRIKKRAEEAAARK
ncbi:cell surface protein [Seiridium cupressi]